jgi:hypothetical protein
MVLIYLVLAWLLIAVMIYQSYVTVQQGSQYLRRLHSIPCSRCVFCTGDYRLKCTVNPHHACTETAIGCRDFESRSVASSNKVIDYVPF